MQPEEFKKAIKTLGLIKRMTKEDVKQRYKELSKEFHPDKPNGSEEKFQEINEAYQILMYYIDNFRFMLDDEEFKVQYPHSGKSIKDWLNGL